MLKYEIVTLWKRINDRIKSLTIADESLIIKDIRAEMNPTPTPAKIC